MRKILFFFTQQIKNNTNLRAILTEMYRIGVERISTPDRSVNELIIGKDKRLTRLACIKSSIKQKGQTYLQAVLTEINQNFAYEFYIAKQTKKYNHILGLLAITQKMLMATQIYGVGKYKPHNALIATDTIYVKFINDTSNVSYQQNLVYEKRVPNNMIFFDLLQLVCQSFQCDISEVYVKTGNAFMTSKLNGLTIQQLNLQGICLRVYDSARQSTRKQKLIQNGQLSLKLKAVLTQIFFLYAVDKKMGVKQCVKFTSAVTKSDSYPNQDRIINFMKQNDHDHDGYLTLQNFLNFYKNSLISKGQTDVWKNLKNIGYRSDLKQQMQDVDPMPDHLMLRSYLHKNQQIYQTLFQMSRSTQNQQMRDRSRKILQRLPTCPQRIKQVTSNDLNLASKDNFQTEYILTIIQNQLQNINEQQTCRQKRIKFIKQNKSLKIYESMQKYFSIYPRDKQQIQFVLIQLQILRSLCQIPNLKYNIALLSSHTKIPDNFTLPYSTIFLTLAEQSIQDPNCQTLEQALALQLIQEPKPLSSSPSSSEIDALKLAIKGAHHNQYIIRQICCNFLYMLSLKDININQLFNIQAKENTCQPWFQTLTIIINNNHKGQINLQNAFNSCMLRLQERTQSIEYPYDAIIYGNLVVMLAIIKKQKVEVNLQKIVSISSNVLNKNSRKLIYEILTEIDFDFGLIFVLELVQNIKIFPDRQLQPKNKYIGLTNLGSTCYVNSILQLLFWVQQLRSQIISLQDQMDVQVPEKIKQAFKKIGGEQLCNEIKKMYIYLQNGCNKYYDTTAFCKAYRYRGKEINIKLQEDAHQFFNHFLQIMEIMLQKGGKSQIFDKLFHGKTVSEVVCQECQNKISNEQKFSCVTVEVKNMKNLKESLDKFAKPEQIQGYFCSNCQRKVDKIVRRTRFSKLPQFLMINLLRIVHEIDKQIKISSKFQFPQTINFTQYTILSSKTSLKTQSTQNTEQINNDNKVQNSQTHQNQNQPTNLTYKLKSIVIHSGTCQSGHYYSIVRINNKWYKFDDGIVSQCHLSDIQRQGFGSTQQSSNFKIQQNIFSTNAYILCYQKQSHQSQSQSQNNIPKQNIIQSKHIKNKLKSHILQQIKIQKQQIINQLKVCNTSIFQYCLQVFVKIKPIGIEQQAIKGYNQQWQNDINIQKYNKIYQLSIILFRVFNKYCKIDNYQNNINNNTCNNNINNGGNNINNNAIISKLGTQIYYLLYLIPQKSYQFIKNTTYQQCLNFLCFHSDINVKNSYKFILIKCIQQFQIFYTFKLFHTEQPIGKHLSEIIIKFRELFNQKLLYENIYRTQQFFQFWRIITQYFNQIKNYVIQTGLIPVLGELLLNGQTGYQYQNQNQNQMVMIMIEQKQNNKQNKKYQTKIIPTNIAKLICEILKNLYNYIIQQWNKKDKSTTSINQNIQNIQQFKTTIINKYFPVFLNPDIWLNILKNQYDQQKLLSPVIAKLSQNNQQFSIQIAQIFLKSMRSFSEKPIVRQILLEYILSFISIKDTLHIKRIKWILGISQLQMDDDYNFGFHIGQKQKSTLFLYVSTLYFSQFQKYPPVLQRLVTMSLQKYIDSYSLYMSCLVIQAAYNSQVILEYLWTMPSPLCYFKNYYQWLNQFLKRLEDVQVKCFIESKSEVIMKLKAILKILNTKIEQFKLSKSQIPNMFIFGRNLNIDAKYQVAYSEYKLNLLQHTTYIIANQPTGQGNKSIQSDFFRREQSKYFLSDRKVNHKELNQSKLQKQKQIENLKEFFGILVAKTMYTLEIFNDFSLKLTFNLKNFNEEIYMKPGKSFISFPYEQINIKQQEQLQKVIRIQVLQPEIRMWNSRKLSEDNSMKNMKQPIQILLDNRGKLQCSACTFLNDSHRNQCQVCDNIL